MQDIKTDQGERLDLLIEDNEAVKAQLLVSSAVGEVAIIDKEANFTDKKAYITLVKADTDTLLGDYVYQIRLYDDEGEYIVLDSGCDDGNCSTGKFIVCPVIKEA